MENNKKVQEVLKELNGERKKPIWFPVDGFKLLPEVTYKKARKDVSINPSSGYPVKIFVNIQTGEIKVFAAILFEVN